MLIFARVIKLCVQAQALYLLILNIKSCWHNCFKYATQLLGESNRQIRTRTELQSTRTLRATTVKNIIVTRKTLSRARRLPMYGDIAF